MEHPIQLHLGKDRRIAFPARFCKEADLNPGDAFFVRHDGSQIVLTPVEDEAEQMRQELKAMLPKDADLMAELRAIRDRDVADENHHR
jgi:bifunctional DNA-binding transcriptional regulator/antitoxin component of YhaV-PrlF toxin-antitoxin module